MSAGEYSRVNQSIQIITVRAGSAPPSCFGTGHVNVLSTLHRKAVYADASTDVPAHLISVLPVRGR